MASLNLRKVPDELKRTLKAQAGHLGTSLEIHCLRILSAGAALKSWANGDSDAIGGPVKSALPEKKSESSGKPAKVRRAGKSPIVVPKGKSLTEVLMQPGPVDSGHAGFASEIPGVNHSVEVPTCPRCGKHEDVVMWGVGSRCKACGVNF